MSPDPRSLDADAPISAAIRWMTRRGYRHLPVVEGGEGPSAGALVGVVSAGDLIDYLADHFPTEVYNLPPAQDQDTQFNSREGG